MSYLNRIDVLEAYIEDHQALFAEFVRLREELAALRDKAPLQWAGQLESMLTLNREALRAIEQNLADAVRMLQREQKSGECAAVASDGPAAPVEDLLVAHH